MLGNQRLASPVGGSDAPVRLIAPAPTYIVLTLLVAGLLINSAIVLVALPRTAGALDYSLKLGDLYDLIAKNLYQGYGYRVEPGMGETMLREPGYPLLIAAVFKIRPYSDQAPRVACIVLAFGAALLLLLLTRQITGDRTIGLIAALLFLLYPATLVSEARAGNELSCIFTILASILALYRAVEKGCVWWYGLAGLLLGVGALVRGEVLLFPLIILAYLLYTAMGWEERGRTALRMVAFGTGVLVATSPWIIRNYLLVHKFVPTATLAGVAAQEGLYTCEYLSQYESFRLAQMGAGRERAEIARQLRLQFVGVQYYQFFYTPQEEVEFNRALLNRVSREYRGHPGVLVGCAAKNVLFNFWFLGKTPQATRMNVLVQLPLLALALGGLIVLYKRGLLRKAAIIVLYGLYILIMHAIIIAHARHSMLVVPFLAVPAAVLLARAWHGLRTNYPRAQPLEIGIRNY